MTKPKSSLRWFERIVLALVPGRERRRRFRRLLKDGRAVFAEHFVVPYWKFLALSRDRDRVSTLVVGSSHAYYGYFAEEGEFNLADVSCDLRRSFELLSYWLSCGMKGLRRVVLFYDVFSPGNVLERSSESFRLVPYVRLYGFRTDKPRQDTGVGIPYAELDGIFERGLRGYHPQIDDDYRGNFGYGFTPYRSPDEQLDRRVRGHLRLNSGGESAYVERIRALLHGSGIGLTLVLPPLREDFRALLPDDRRSLLRGLDEAEVGREGLHILNLIDAPEFSRADFNDMDHLNERGARKLAALVRLR